ncbi:hypothetical protein BGX27_002825 [Mortierella sp. AM989]|nr:hypothetical protein BGX27_002825 [Mortierella sp. AM989]
MYLYMDEEDARRVYESGEQFILNGRKLGIQYAQGRRKITDMIVAALHQEVDSTAQALVATLAPAPAPETDVTDDETVAALCVVATRIHPLVLAQYPPAAVLLPLVVMTAGVTATDPILLDVDRTLHVAARLRLGEARAAADTHLVLRGLEKWVMAKVKLLVGTEWTIESNIKEQTSS